MCFTYFCYLQETNEEVQIVNAFLLNDSLMVAAHIRRRKGPVRYRFQALYELDNMAVVEMKDSDTIRNAFKILMFPDSHLYQVYMYIYIVYITIDREMFIFRHSSRWRKFNL